MKGLERSLFAAVVATAFVLNADGQSATPNGTSTRVGSPGRFPTNQLRQRAELYYAGVWGVDSLELRYTESGEMIRFSYRVVDPEKAAALGDKNGEPALEDPQGGVRLSIPQMENVGKLRQNSTPEAGKSYWMAFSNTGRRVRPGHTVDVVIGHFHAHGLVVN